MKIMGFTYISGQQELLLKGDSALLVNRKPFFIPESTIRLAAHPCAVLRISKLGKNISPRFAFRYIDAIAAGLHIEDQGALDAARTDGRSWVHATAADGSLPVGTFFPMTEEADYRLLFQMEGMEKRLFVAPPAIAEALSAISRVITIRQGDLLFLTADDAPFYPQLDQVITAAIESETNGAIDTDNLYCKIK